ncbi:hypothetical protein RJ639_016916 [Escallonia herrerae]|uniref:Uncharacterized protein n=1 Tax=Escallonia herrerae TaxID=1293975 RepID=A0AA88VAU2_9ASTE|nr:hypothetical protein RJ639_016916 [Escallonia herrerae]
MIDGRSSRIPPSAPVPSRPHGSLLFVWAYFLAHIYIHAHACRLTFRTLIKGLESDGGTSLSLPLRQEAQKYYGQSLKFLEEEEEMALS